jgi:hypothetical protein
MTKLDHVAWLPLALGCAAAPHAPPAETAPAADLVVVERDTTGDAWLATWHLAEPTRELRFERPAGGFRGAVFEVLTPGFALERDGDIEVLRTSGDAAAEVRVRFPEYDRQLTREYEFFRRFTDGGVAIYTGHLVARPVGDAAERPFVRRLRFVPPAGAAVIVGGQRHDGAVEWTDAGGRGTYVYLGSATPVVSDDVISIIDPGLPAWLERRTRDALPQLFALYGGRLQAEPDARPVVLFDYTPGEAVGYSNGGGTLPGLIQLGVEGGTWQTESRAALRQLLHFLAHEAAHVWNGEIAHYPGNEDAWLHEGSADALAERALLKLGVIDDDAFLDYQSAALNDCRAGLAVTPLRTSVQQGRPRMAYTCGNMIALLTESALRAHGADLFEFWRALIARALSQGGVYRAEDYVAVWRTLGAADTDIAALQALVDGDTDIELLPRALRATGVRVEPADPLPSHGLALARDAMARLMPADCGGRIGYRTTPTGFIIDRDVVCNNLIPGSRVVAFGGHDVLQAGHLAFDHVREACSGAGRARVTLHTDDSAAARDVDVACTAQLPARPEYLRIRAP